ncbi:50S ribosomal protein L25 [Synergistaceae bacterium OttesenSCG-928-I11]|nr:50S ribosomal protein L25 [Synergistaceae bacterium OttesenSCG-928-I11]
MATREATTIKFTKRDRTGKGACRKLRAKDIIPAVFYGPEYKEGIVGTVGAREIGLIANAPNAETNMIDLEIEDGKTEMALLRGVQRHAITQKILHVDLYQLVKGHKVKVSVPIRYINKEISQGVKMGGVLEQPMREIEILVLPREIPAEIVLDAAKMAIGSEICVRDLEFPESAELQIGEDEIVLTIVRPKSMTDTAAEEEGAEESVEVEVVGKGKRKEEEA